MFVFEVIGPVVAPDCEIDPLEVTSEWLIHEETLGGIVHLLILKINIIFKLLLLHVIFLQQFSPPPYSIALPTSVPPSS